MSSTIFYGDWMKFRVTLSSLLDSNANENKEKDLLEKLGRAIVRSLKSHIRSQDLGWVPLSESTVRKKGFDTIYVDSGDFLKSLSHEVTVTNGVASLEVFPDGDHSSGIPMQEIADYLEYGTVNMAPRPLWRPVFAELESGRYLKNILKDFIADIEGPA